jgi:hypothetical protein
MLSDWPVKAQDDAQFRHPFSRSASRGHQPLLCDGSDHTRGRFHQRSPMHQDVDAVCASDEAEDYREDVKVEPGVASAAQTWHWRGRSINWRPPWPRSRSRTSPTGILSAATSTSTASTARLAWVWTAAMRRHDEAGEEIAVGDFLEGLVRHRGLQIRNMARYLTVPRRRRHTTALATGNHLPSVVATRASESDRARSTPSGHLR